MARQYIFFQSLLCANLTSFSMNVSRSGCSQAVLRYCGFILSECEFGRTLILSQCEPETALVIEHADLCYRAATSRARRWANRLRCCGLRIIGVSICNGKGI